MNTNDAILLHSPLLPTSLGLCSNLLKDKNSLTRIFIFKSTTLPLPSRIILLSFCVSSHNSSDCLLMVVIWPLFSSSDSGILISVTKGTHWCHFISTSYMIKNIRLYLHEFKSQIVYLKGPR